MNDLHSHVTKIATKGLTHLLPAGDSFFAVVFNTTKHRDKAINNLKQVTFKIDGNAVALTVLKFGDESSGKVTAGFGDTANHVADTMVGLITNHGWTSQSSLKFTTYPVLKRGVSNGQYVTHFHSLPPWCGKQIVINGQVRLITSESPAACRFYGGRDHSLVGCTESTEWVLEKDKESLAKYMISAASNMDNDTKMDDAEGENKEPRLKRKHKDRAASTTSSSGKKTKLTDEDSGHSEEDE